MYPTHLLPPTLRRAAQLLTLDAMLDDISHNPYLIPVDDVLDKEIGYWRTVPEERWFEMGCRAAPTCQGAC